MRFKYGMPDGIMLSERNITLQQSAWFSSTRTPYMVITWSVFRPLQLLSLLLPNTVSSLLLLESDLLINVVQGSSKLTRKRRFNQRIVNFRADIRSRVKTVRNGNTQQLYIIIYIIEYPEVESWDWICGNKMSVLLPKQCKTCIVWLFIWIRELNTLLAISL